MLNLRMTTWLLPAGLLAGTLGLAQTGHSSPSQPSAQTHSAASTSTLKRSKITAKRQKPKATASRVITIPLETTPPTPATDASFTEESREKAADQRLLEQQQAQSSRAAQITNQTVEQAQKQQDSVQREQRIQDAPGPAQTGVVPIAGPPVQPAKNDTRIQDAPGPAQTVPTQAPAPPPQ